MRIILFLVLIVLILLIIAASNDIINKKAKAGILVLIIAIFGAAFYYTQNIASTQNTSLELLQAYEQGKGLKCGAYEVNASNFGFEYGTQSFVAKRGAKDLQGIIIDVKNCQIKE